MTDEHGSRGRSPESQATMDGEWASSPIESRDDISCQYAHAAAFFQALRPYGEPHELRVPSLTQTNYHWDADAFAEQATALSQNGAPAVYVTLNPVNSALARTTRAAGDDDITRRRNLLIDVDAARANAARTNATEEELAAALALRDRIRDALHADGWPDPVAVTMSGNGGGLIYRIDLPNDPASAALVTGALRALAARFDDDTAHVDTGVGNAARITKVPGTRVRKGPASPERPHRFADGETNPDPGTVTKEQLRALAGEPDETGGAGEGAGSDADEIRAALRAQGIGWKEQRKDHGTLLLHLDRCPTGEHGKSGPTDTTIFIQPSGRRGFECQHNTCQGKTWQDAKKALGLGAGDGEERESQASLAVKLAGDLELFHDDLPRAYAAVPISGRVETHEVLGTTMRLLLRKRFWEKHGKAINSQALSDALGILAGQAIWDGPEREVFVRIGHQGDKVYLDLCNDAWEAVEIDGDGWRVIKNPPVRFRRPSGLLPLPAPERGGSINLLRPLTNVADDKGFVLAVAWVIGAFQPAGPYPVLLVAGRHGAAKTTLLRALRGIFDPNIADVRQPPKTAEDVLIAARNSQVLLLDNLSQISDWLSDALCRLATGGGMGKRGLYTDLEEVLVNIMRPTGVSSIGDVGQNSDLLDRSILLRPPRMTKAQRVPERRYWADFEKARPAILGAILNGVSAAIRNLPNTHASDLPRMADFAEWVMAAEEGLGWAPGTFIAAYNENQGQALEQALETAVIYPALMKLLAKTPDDRRGSPGAAWAGTPTELLMALEDAAGESARRAKDWPKAAHALTSKLRMLSENLLEVGVDWQEGRDNRERHHRFLLREEYWQRRERARESSRSSRQAGGDARDAARAARRAEGAAASGPADASDGTDARSRTPSATGLSSRSTPGPRDGGDGAYNPNPFDGDN